MRNSIERAAVLFSAAWAFPLAGCGAGGAPAAEVVVSDKTPPEVRRLAADMGLEFSDPNAPVGPDGETPLIVAAKAGNAAHVRRLIESGAVVNLGDNNGRFPLWFAVRENRVKIAELLMDAGADAGEGMLHAAARGDAAEMVRLLVVRGADVNARDYAGETPLHIAAAHDAAEVIRNLLIHPDADVSARTPDGRTPMHYAAKGDGGEAAVILAAYPNTNIDAADNGGDTPLHLALKNDANRAAEVLMDHGADIGAKNGDGRTPMEIAKRRINKDFITLTKVTSAEAQFELGNRHYTGGGAAHDRAEAAKWYRRAAGRGLPEAQFAICALHLAGDGVAKSHEGAEKWCRRAAEQGSADGQYGLGYLLYYGKGISQDYEQASKWFHSAAKLGNVQAQIKLGDMLLDGSAVLRDATEQDSAPSTRVGLLSRKWTENLFSPRERVEAAKWYRRAAEQGDMVAQNKLGEAHKQGIGVLENSREAEKWFRLSAKQGYAAAQVNLGKVLEFSFKSQNYAEAAKWYRSAAEQGLAEAQYKLGRLHMKGKGVKWSEAEAAKWYRRAAEQGHATAQSFLGGLYLSGDGVPQNYAKAYEWYSLAEMNGNRVGRGGKRAAALRLSAYMVFAAQAEAIRRQAEIQRNRKNSADEADDKPVFNPPSAPAGEIPGRRD